MSGFKPTDLSIKRESEELGEIRVVKIDQDQAFQVTQFHFNRIAKPGDGDYAAVKAKYGALAATDPDRQSKTQKESRFSISPLLKDPLSVAEEERRAIDLKVQERLAELSVEAKEQGRKEGYDEGFERGKAEAFEKFREEGAQAMQSLMQTVQEVEGVKSRIFQENEEFLMELIFKVARMIVLKEVTVDREYVSRLAKTLIEQVNVRENIRIRISEADFAQAQKLKADLETAFGQLRNLDIRSSAQVERGGCIVETQWNSIDATIDTQLENIQQALVGAPAGGGGTQA